MKRLSASLLSLGLAALVTVSGSGAVYASTASGSGESAQVTEVPSRSLMATVYNDFTPSVSGLTAEVSSYSTYAYVNWSGVGRNFKVYLDNKLYTTQVGYSDYESSKYNEETEEYDYVYSCSSNSYSAYFYDLQMGQNHTVKVVPTDKDDKEVSSAAKSVTIKIEMPKISSLYGSVSSKLYGDSKKGYSGYGTLYAYLSWGTDKGGATKYEIQRSTSKSSGFKKIGESTSTYYEDESIEAGKTYYYRVRPYANTVAGDFSSVYSLEAELSNSYTYITLNKSSKPVIICGTSSRYSGFQIYRSTKQAKGYKKIATISDDRYTDASAKVGSTYYYKVAPYYYNPKTKKTKTGEMSDPMGVKVVLGSGLYLEAQQTGKTKVKLSWQKAKDTAGYDVYVRSGMEGDAYKYLGTTKKTSYTAKKLSATEGYTFVVQAYKQNKKKVKTYYVSSAASVTMGIHAPDADIASRSFSSNSAKDTITVKNKIAWDKVYGASGYYVEKYDRVTGQYTQIKKLGASAKSYTYSQTIKSGSAESIELRIVAYKGSKTYSSNSCYLGANIGSASSIKVKKKGTTGTTISWKAAAGADSYRVYRYTPMGSYVEVGETAKTSITDIGLTPGVNYRYSVRGYNSKLGIDSDSNYYGESNTQYGNKITYPGQVYFTLKNAAPTLSKVSNAKGKKATVKWKKVSSASSFVIYRSTKKSSGFSKVGTAKKGATSFTDKGLKKGTTYYYKVAYLTSNEAGASAESALSAAKSVKITK